MNEEAISDLRKVLDQAREPVEFGPHVSEDFRQGYAAGRSDVVPFLDAAFTAILRGRLGEEPRAARAAPREPSVRAG